jgi:pyrimidine-specific ribonucleoside hydrolase
MKVFYPVILFSLLHTICGALFSQPIEIKRNHTVIIDTDCGIGDFNAINFIFSRPEISVRAILISDGNIPPEEGFKKVAGLLKETGRDSIPAAYGRTINSPEPPRRGINQSLKWSNTVTPAGPQKSAVDLMSEIIRPGAQKISLVCLGPLTNISDIIEKYPEIINGIDRIIWYNDSANPFKGFNYEYDSQAAQRLAASGIRMDVISNLGYPAAIFDTTFLSEKNTSQTELANRLKNFNQRNSTVLNINPYMPVLCDELVAVYLINPSLFDMNPLTGKTRIRYNSGYNWPALREVIKDMISGSYFPESNVVFTRFPAQRELFSYDVRQIMDSAIARYGEDEWKACVITDEFHGHLGVYSIVGAKMGIKARELFGVGPDVLTVITHAGIKPPYSCLTDGIQVSTGATLGMGLISVAPGSETRAMAEFSYKGRTIRISLKDEYLRKVEADITAGIVKFGLMDDGYWKMVRQSAIRYWLEWDRDKIFDIEEGGGK